MAERRYTMIFYVALVVAAGAAYGVYRLLESTKARSKVATSTVVVALRDIPEGSTIDRTTIGSREWPVPTVPPGAFKSVDSVVGRITRVAVFAGEPMVPGRLAPAGTAPGLEVRISPGKRAMAVRINDIAGISGFIQPNSRVDVLVNIRDATGRGVAKLFMENMRVLSVGTQVERGDDGKPINATTATIEVTPQEAERLAVAMNQGNIQLVLRGYGDPDSITTRGAASSDVLSQLRSEPEASPQVPRPRSSVPRSRAVPPSATPSTVLVVVPPRRADSSTVQIYRGTKMSNQKVERDTSAAATPR
ncbi:MAG: Flp pilus assembly protein CpaB [Gemmatimonadaceae bacterium]